MGDVLFNLGGPGDSSVQFPLSESSRNMVPDLLGSSYNIIYMDPRRVNNSGPSIDCFSGHPAIRDFAIIHLPSINTP
ncbi:hypothetical protein K504DRAFT_501236 [Pleomassaria siparia CBS 279.74]|uniref:AB hydrolase-1 domain-containing protein n=1 Tax=Pleomassaria siparia CBS 279.74 TaxID=1314801 RepID=A0A6G1KBM5_9PLEO|nr:hypothetical protein K504DRAFT_501236 [Pleomassaria siparia CBS 279.74]